MKLISPELPNKETDMVAVDKHTWFCLVVKIWPEINSADYMPASAKLLLETLLYVLGCILQIRDLSLHHLAINVLGQLQCILFHLYGHVAEFYVCQYLLYCWRQSPIFRNSCLALLLIVKVFLFILGVYSFCCHYYSNISFKIYAYYITKSLSESYQLCFRSVSFVDFFKFELPSCNVIMH